MAHSPAEAASRRPGSAPADPKTTERRRKRRLVWLLVLLAPLVAEFVSGNLPISFLWLLLLTSVSGLVLLVLRETALMGTLLTIHLGIVAALFLTLPYGKFAHVVYRYAALVRYQIEQKGEAQRA